jgi:hypothetical protein
MTQHEIFTEAASTLTAEDLQHLKSSMPKTDTPESDANEPATQPQPVEPAKEEISSKRPGKRQSVPHVWPELGTELHATYFGVEYKATVVKAAKRLKSGKQIRIDSGPAKNTICDSLSDAMLQATAKQRDNSNLNRKGVANGWDFWNWPGKTI